MAELIIPIRVWLDSYPAYKIHKIFTTTTTIGFSLGGSSSYTSTDETSKNKHT